MATESISFLPLSLPYPLMSFSGCPWKPLNVNCNIIASTLALLSAAQTTRLEGLRSQRGLQYFSLNATKACRLLAVLFTNAHLNMVTWRSSKLKFTLNSLFIFPRFAYLDKSLQFLSFSWQQDTLFKWLSSSSSGEDDQLRGHQQLQWSFFWVALLPGPRVLHHITSSKKAEKNRILCRNRLAKKPFGRENVEPVKC